MLFFLISLLAGILTVATPCVLPLLPVIVGGSIAGGSRKRTYTVIFSLIITIIFFTFLLKFLTIFINIPSEFWSYFSGIILLILALSILFPKYWYKIPLLGKISVMSNKSLGTGYLKNNFWGDVLIGASLGPVFSTCSPTYFVILATVLPASILLGTIYLLSFSIGLGGALFLISIFGQKIINKFTSLSDEKSSIRKIIGILFLLVAILIMTGLDKKIENYLINSSSYFDVTRLETKLLENANENNNMPNLININSSSTDSLNFNDDLQSIINKAKSKNVVYGTYKEITDPAGFLNTPNGEAIKISDYIGKKIILIDFLTYSCINCQRTFPYLNDWYEKYKDKGLIIIGIHTPEFAFEKNKDNVEKALEEFGIEFPVVLDNNYGTWKAYQNNYWPRKYIIDLDGDIVYDHAGEGEYQEAEDKIVELLNTIPGNNLKDGVATTTFNPDFYQIGSHETYLGYNRLDYSAIAISSKCADTECTFTAPVAEIFPSNSFSFDGKWNISSQYASAKSGASLYYNFTASKVHLVMESNAGAKVKIILDGDADNAKEIEVKNPDLYTLVDLDGKYGKHIVKMEIISGEINAYAFTFS